MEKTPALPAPQLFSLAGQNVLITGASRGASLTSLSLSLTFLPLPFLIVLSEFRSESRGHSLCLTVWT